MNIDNQEALISEVAQKIKAGDIQPWKTESVLLDEYGLRSPEHFRTAALGRRKLLENLTGFQFKHLELPDKPYLQSWRCPKDDCVWHLAAGDTDTSCAYCGSVLTPHGTDPDRCMQLVNNYIGGREEYYGYAGQVRVVGDVEKTFTNLLAYGPGAGVLGISVGCFRINKFGGAEVKVGKWGGAARNLGYIFADEENREKAVRIAKTMLPDLRVKMEKRYLAEYRGQVYEVEFVRRQHHGQYYLNICFYTRFEQARGHADTSASVGFARARLDRAFEEQGVHVVQSLIAMGFDGDLKPSPRNRRGRYVSAQVRLPIAAYEKASRTGIDSLFRYLEIDRQGVLQEQGWFLYSGMGGEVLPALYRGTKVNPRPYNVAIMENVYAEREGDELIFGVELPNLEAGVGSLREGPICPAAREVLKFIGVSDTRDFAAVAAAIVLAAEFNFTLLHLRGEMYAPKSVD